MSESVRTIKKYPNRRLYDTANSGYITLADVKQMVLENIDFQVVDAKSGDDLTRAILLQIILDEEGAGVPMFSSEMLAQMIRFYGSAQQTIMGQYIEQNVQAFLAIQKKLQEQAKQVYGDKMLLTPELWKQFMQMQAPAMQGMLGKPALHFGDRVAVFFRMPVLIAHPGVTARGVLLPIAKHRIERDEPVAREPRGDPSKPRRDARDRVVDAEHHEAAGAGQLGDPCK